MPVLKVLFCSAVFVFGAFAVAEPATPNLFDQLPTQPHWQPVKPDYELSPTQLVVRPEKGTDLYISVDGKTRALNAPRLLFAPKGDFTYSTKVTASTEGQYNGGALVVYSDDDNWVKYLYEVQDGGRVGVVMDVVKKGISDIAYFEQTKSNQMHLMIVRAADQLFFHHSPDGSHWKLDRVLPARHFPAFKTGFEAQAPLSDAAKIEFSEVRYEPNAPENPWVIGQR